MNGVRWRSKARRVWPGGRFAAWVRRGCVEMLRAAEDAADVIAARAALADPAPSVPLAEVLAENADVLAAYPDDEE